MNGERFTPNGLEIVSVTTANGILDKPGIAIWKQNVTAEGGWNLARPRSGYRRCKECRGVSRAAVCAHVIKEKDKPERVCGGSTGPYYLPHHWRQFLADIQSAKLDADSIRDEAAIRGTNIHEIHEDYVRLGQVPDATKYPEEWRGYVRSMTLYIMWCEKQGLIPESVEAIVGSATHGFAGACDTVAVSTGRSGKRSRHDFKTSKQSRALTHFRQLGAYDGAAVEMGTPPCDELGVVILPADGNWDPGFHISYTHEVEWPEGGPYQSFLNVLRVWRDNKPLQKHEDKTYRAVTKRARDAAKAAKPS